MLNPKFPAPEYFVCDDCGERYDWTERCTDESEAVQMCDTDWADFQGQLAAERQADYYHRPRAAVPGYDLDDPKHPDYVERLIDAMDAREVFA